MRIARTWLVAVPAALACAAPAAAQTAQGDSPFTPRQVTADQYGGGNTGGQGNNGNNNPGGGNPGNNNPGGGNPGANNPGKNNPGKGKPGRGVAGTSDSSSGNPVRVAAVAPGGAAATADAAGDELPFTGGALGLVVGLGLLLLAVGVVARLGQRRLRSPHGT